MSIEPMAIAPAPQSSGKADEKPTVSRSLFRQAYHDTLSRFGAKVGLAWLFFLVFCAVFAPFLANSYPYLVKQDGKWSSPLLRHLTPSDVLILIAFATTVILFISRRTTFLRSVVILVAVVLASALPAFLLVKPPPLNVYSFGNGTVGTPGEHALFTPIPYSPRDRKMERRLLPPGVRHWAGTDTDGADMMSMMLHASRIALSIGFLATAISLVIGVTFGAVIGYYVGAVDLIGMRIIEIVDSIPGLFLLISITAFIQDRNIYVMMAAIGAISWTQYARFVRAEFFTLRKLDYVQAAVAAGLPKRIILFRHMLANALTPILVSSTFGVASAILYESTLSFLGIGLVDESSWGSLLDQARASGAGFIWWIALFPGMAIFLTVFAYNLVGEAIRDALDPKLRKRD
jgi:peptide/nickel transport system permease protein